MPGEKCARLSEEIYIKEDTISQLTDQILMDLYKEQPGSVYFLLYLEYYPGEEELLVEIPEILLRDHDLAGRAR